MPENDYEPDKLETDEFEIDDDVETEDDAETGDGKKPPAGTDALEQRHDMPAPYASQGIFRAEVEGASQRASQIIILNRTHQGGHDLIARVIALAGLLAAVGGAIWWWFVRCERDCAASDREAQELFRRGELLSVLTLIDGTDARCRCSRFTSGDAPAQYALARACLRQLLIEGRRDEAEGFLARARSPILRELAKSPVVTHCDREGTIGAEADCRVRHRPERDRLVRVKLLDRQRDGPAAVAEIDPRCRGISSPARALVSDNHHQALPPSLVETPIFVRDRHQVGRGASGVAGGAGRDSLG